MLIETPTITIPVDHLVEIQNSSGDTFCVTVRGKSGWHAQIVRGRQRHRLGNIQIFIHEMPDQISLKTAVDSFLIGDYRNFQEYERKTQQRMSIVLSMIGMIIMMALGLTFLAFMISIFQRN
jgi:hypothetical protein